MFSRHFVYPQDWNSSISESEKKGKLSILNQIVHASQDELVNQVTVQCEERGTLLGSLIEIGRYLTDLECGLISDQTEKEKSNSDDLIQALQQLHTKKTALMERQMSSHQQQHEELRQLYIESLTQLEIANRRVKGVTEKNADVLAEAKAKN